MSLEKFSLHPIKSPSASTTIIFGNPNETKKFLRSHRATWYHVIYFIILASPIPNHVIQHRHVRIFRYPYWSWISPSYQNSINTTSNGVYESIVLSIFWSSLDHKFADCKFDQAVMNWSTSVLTIGHKNCASILNTVLWSWLCPASGNTCHADITIFMNLKGTTLRLSQLTLAVCGVS